MIDQVYEDILEREGRPLEFGDLVPWRNEVLPWHLWIRKMLALPKTLKRGLNQWNGGLTNNNCWWSNETGDGAKKNGDFNEQKLWLGNSGIHGEFMIGKLVNVLGGASLLVSDQWPIYYHYYPIGSMYGTYANIWDIWMVNVTIYSIHGSYGYWNIPHIREIWDGRCPLTNWDGDPSN